MTHSGERFYPEGVHWDDPIARGTLPDLLAKAASDYGARPALEFRDRPIGYTELEAMVEIAAASFLRAGYGRNASIALFLGNSPDHPRNFFGALKVSITLAFVGTTVSEMTAANEGIGYLLISAGSSMQMGLAFAGLLVVGAMAMAMYELFARMERRLTGWAHRGG